MKTDGCLVYQHKRADNGSIFYVGKASNKYRQDQTQNRNKTWHQVVQDAKGFISEIVANDLDEELSFLVEREYIDKLKKIGASICNKTSGGQGTTGWRPSAETRALWSQQRRGKAPHNKGNKQLPEPKAPQELEARKQQANIKRSESLKGRTPWNKGITWENIALKGRVPYNKGQMVVGSKRWKIQQNKLLKAMRSES
jgi:hypothetical protein